MALIGGHLTKDNYPILGIFGNYGKMDNYEKIFYWMKQPLAGHLKGLKGNYFIFRVKYVILRIKIIVGN